MADLLDNQSGPIASHWTSCANRPPSTHSSNAAIPLEQRNSPNSARGSKIVGFGPCSVSSLVGRACLVGVVLSTPCAEGAFARQTTEYANLSAQGTLPTTGGAGGIASYGISADGDIVAFKTSATDVLPGVGGLGLEQVYVRDRRRATTVLASSNMSGVAGNGDSVPMDVSWHGRWILYRSMATDLVPNDFNAAADMFVRDLETSTTSIVSLGTGGIAGNAVVGYYGSVSIDGRFVAFDALASNWIAGDTNSGSDVFVHDRSNATTTLVSVAIGGGTGNGTSSACHMSDDGRFVVFVSSASNLVVGDTNGQSDAFLRDLLLGTTTIVSVSTNGVLANAASLQPEVSNDGRFVVFSSAATNLDPNDTSPLTDVYRRDVASGTTTRISVGIGGNQLNHNSVSPSISADGLLVAFDSRATNHGFQDVNGFNSDVFVMHVPTMTLHRASQSTSGTPADVDCLASQISADGRSVLFVSFSSILFPNAIHNNFVNLFVHDLLPSVIEGYCSGDDPGNLCPCGPGSSGGLVAGCTNSAGERARLSAAGNAQISLDTLTITARGIAPGSFAVLLQGDSAPAGGLGSIFGDGILCVSGAILRLIVRPVVSNTVSYGLAAADPTLSSLGMLSGSGSDRFYQVWYRDAFSYCTPSTFNLTNGIRIGWTQ